MQENAYRALARSEPQGWYYQARARAVKTLVRRFLPRSANLEILDIGCGTGGTSHSFSELGHVTGLEPNEVAIELLRENYPDLDVVPGSVGQLPELVAPASFDLATIMGVLYHENVTDPVAALRDVRRTLRNDGWIIWNEAAYPFLRRKHDDFVHTGRRFYPRAMLADLEAAGFEVCFGSHLLSWAFPIALALAAVHRARSLAAGWLSLEEPADPADDRPLPGFLNAILRGLTYWEWWLSLHAARLPFGISFLVIARNRRRGAEVGREAFRKAA